MESKEAVIPVERLEFDQLNKGDVIVVTTGTGEEAWQYHFEVTDSSHRWPEGTISATTPFGEISEPFAFALHGCGKWTTRQQNPVQTQELGFTPYYDGLIVGRFMWGLPKGSDERISFDNKGQEISAIELRKAA